MFGLPFSSSAQFHPTKEEQPLFNAPLMVFAHHNGCCSAELGLIFGPFSVNWKGILLAIVLWLLTNKVSKTQKLHPIVFIGASALVGILFSMG